VFEAAAKLRLQRGEVKPLAERDRHVRDDRLELSAIGRELREGLGQRGAKGDDALGRIGRDPQRLREAAHAGEAEIEGGKAADRLGQAGPGRGAQPHGVHERIKQGDVRRHALARGRIVTGAQIADAFVELGRQQDQAR